jgi:large subunit ribosomal protein L9
VSVNVILLQDVEKVGLRGEVVSVARGFARNYLLPRRLAEEATPAKVAELKRREEQRVRHEAHTFEQAQQMAQKLRETVVHLEAKAGPTGALFGSVTPTNIADELWRTHKIRVDRRKIGLPEPIKRIGRYEIPIELFTDVTVDVWTHVAPEGGELPPEEELGAVEAAEAEAAAAAAAAAAEERAAAEAAIEAAVAAEEPSPDALETTSETESDAEAKPAS